MSPIIIKIGIIIIIIALIISVISFKYNQTTTAFVGLIVCFVWIFIFVTDFQSTDTYRIADYNQKETGVVRIYDLDLLLEMGYEDSVVFESPDFDDAIIGVSDSGNVVYSYELMVESLINNEGMTALDAVEWIDYNTIRSIPYFPNPKPIVMYDLSC